MEVSFKLTREQNQESVSTTSEEEYPCIPIFLEILQNEYMEEKARTDRIDNKAIALLTIIIALITVYVPIFPFKDLAGIYNDTNTCCRVICVLSFFLLLGAIAILLAIHTAKIITDIYKPTEYQAVNFEHLNTDEDLSSNPAHPFQLKLITHYQSIILNNSKVNSKKAEMLNEQVKQVIRIFLLLSISAIGTLICTGIYN